MGTWVYSYIVLSTFELQNSQKLAIMMLYTMLLTHPHDHTSWPSTGELQFMTTAIGDCNDVENVLSCQASGARARWNETLARAMDNCVFTMRM